MRINRRKFEFIAYILVIITGILELSIGLTSNAILAWILITLGVINVVANLFWRRK